MKDRIKLIRHTLGLTQQKFADRLGIKGNTISQYESGRNAPVDAVISLICREFGVNEKWLRTSEGEMFRQDNDGILERMAEEYKLSGRERAIISSFLKLNTDDRAAILRYVDNLVEELARPSASVIISAPSDGRTESTFPNDEMEESDLEFDPEIEAELKTIRNRLYQEKEQKAMLQTLKSGGSATRNWSGNLRADNA